MAGKSSVLAAENKPHTDLEMAAIFNADLETKAKLQAGTIAQLCARGLSNAGVILRTADKDGRHTWTANPEDAETRFALVGFLGRWTLNSGISLENALGTTRGQATSKSPTYRLRLYEKLLDGSVTNIELGNDPALQNASRRCGQIDRLQALGILQQTSDRRIGFTPQATEPMQQLVSGVQAIQSGKDLDKYGQTAHALLANEATFTMLVTQGQADLRRRGAHLPQVILPLFDNQKAMTVNDVWALVTQNSPASRSSVDNIIRRLYHDGMLVPAGKAKGPGGPIKYRLANPPKQSRQS